MLDLLDSHDLAYLDSLESKGCESLPNRIITNQKWTKWVKITLYPIIMVKWRDLSQIKGNDSIGDRAIRPIFHWTMIMRGRVSNPSKGPFSIARLVYRSAHVSKCNRGEKNSKNHQTWVRTLSLEIPTVNKNRCKQNLQIAFCCQGNFSVSCCFFFKMSPHIGTSQSAAISVFATQTTQTTLVTSRPRGRWRPRCGFCL